MAKKISLSETFMREEQFRWFESYIRQVEGYAALAENFAEGCDEEWVAMHFGLCTLAKLMRVDLEQRKKECDENA